jgi:hypothetical protein
MRGYMFTELKISRLVTISSTVAFVIGAAISSIYSEITSSEKILRSNNDEAIVSYFLNDEAAKKWFSTKYPQHEFFVKKISNFTIHSFYASKGSGISRVDAFFYECNSSGCNLIGMKANSKAENFKNEADIFEKDSKLLIHSRSNFLFEFDMGN